MRTISTLIFGIISVIFAGLALAQNVGTFRCGGHLVQEGDSKATVEEHCGEPSFQSYDQWTYDRGSNEFSITLHFEADGTINRITETDPNL
jgi:hypothetical protein